MNLVLDIGNSFAKIALFNSDQLFEKSDCSINELKEVLTKKQFERGLICSVNNSGIATDILNNNKELIYLDDQLKLDNNVHIAHNVSQGRSTVIAANTAIAGSTKIGKNCTVSGACGIIDNLKITDSVNITAGSLVTKSINKPGTYTSGTPLIEHSSWKRNAVIFKKLKDLIKK